MILGEAFENEAAYLRSTTAEAAGFPRCHIKLCSSVRREDEAYLRRAAQLGQKAARDLFLEYTDDAPIYCRGSLLFTDVKYIVYAALDKCEKSAIYKDKKEIAAKLDAE